MVNVFTSENFDAEVLKSETPVFVDFYADWCVPCKMMAPIVEELAKEYEGKIKVGKINVDNCQELAGQYSIMTIPTFMVIKNGEVVDRISGKFPKEEVEELMKKGL